MRILGFGGSNHDFGAAALFDGMIKLAIEDERLNRIKHGNQSWWYSPCAPSIDYITSTLGVTLDDFDLITRNPDLDGHNPAKQRDCIIVGHHLSHAASAFYQSPFQRAALLVCDGSGHALNVTSQFTELETISSGVAYGTSLSLTPLEIGVKPTSSSTWKYLATNSLGHFYKAVTECVGFGPWGQGKLMGLAPYGDHSLVEHLRAFVEIPEEGGFTCKLYNGLAEWIDVALTASPNRFSTMANLAAAAQALFEEALLSIAYRVHRETGEDDLCYSGGAALNVSANSRLLRDGPFRRVFIPPAPGDDGLSVGSALYAYHCLHNHPASPDHRDSSHACLGKEYSSTDMYTALMNRPVRYSCPQQLPRIIAELLDRGNVIALFRGGSELGPRALGRRSIIANPFSARLRDHINLNIKERESFRPLAPVVQAPRAAEFFDTTEPSPFMQFASKVRPSCSDVLSGITHVDGSARLQTLDPAADPFLFELLDCFASRTGFPILINTSLNRRGEPIVETPQDALDCFLATPLDYLVMGDYLVEKHTPWNRRVPCPACPQEAKWKS